MTTVETKDAGWAYPTVMSRVIHYFPSRGVSAPCGRRWPDQDIELVPTRELNSPLVAPRCMACEGHWTLRT